MNTKKFSFNLPLFVSAPDYHDFGHLAYILSELTKAEINYEEISGLDVHKGYGVDFAYDGGMRQAYYAVLFEGEKTSSIDTLIDEFRNGSL